MKYFVIFISVFLWMSCGNQSTIDTNSFIHLTGAENESVSNETLKTPIKETVEDEFPELQTYYIVCLDSSKNYQKLDKSMYVNAKTYHVTIDTAGRSYHTKKNLIALADDDEDEMYAGEYYPRRYPSTNLSLEYLYVYEENVNPKTIGLVAGICEQKSEADSILNIFKPTNPNGFVLKGKVYVGCMH